MVFWGVLPTLDKEFFFLFLENCLSKEHLSLSVGEIWEGTSYRAC